MIRSMSKDNTLFLFFTTSLLTIQSFANDKFLTKSLSVEMVSKPQFCEGRRVAQSLSMIVLKTGK